MSNKKISFRESCLRKIFNRLTKLGHKVNRNSDGVYRDFFIDKGKKILDIKVRCRSKCKYRRDRFNNFINIKSRKNYFFILITSDKNTYVIPSFVICNWLRGRSYFDFYEEKGKKYLEAFNLLD